MRVSFLLRGLMSDSGSDLKMIKIVAQFVPGHFLPRHVSPGALRPDFQTAHVLMVQCCFGVLGPDGFEQGIRDVFGFHLPDICFVQGGIRIKVHSKRCCILHVSLCQFGINSPYVNPPCEISAWCMRKSNPQEVYSRQSTSLERENRASSFSLHAVEKEVLTNLPHAEQRNLKLRQSSIFQMASGGLADFFTTHSITD
ncbi:uncharacterized [Tachysurus ichikawai]